jgi:hypothetical protein
MEIGPFAAGELLADTVTGAFVGSFLVTASGPVWIVGLKYPGRAYALALALSGDRPFIYPGLSPMPRNGLRIVGRSIDITVGELVGNADPLMGDLGIAADGRMVVAVRLVDASGQRDLLFSLDDGKDEAEVGVNNYLWVRQWRLDLVSPDGSRRSTLVDRFWRPSPSPS